MCLTIARNTTVNDQPNIAGEDIIVYKILNENAEGRLFAPVKSSFEYKKGKMHYSKKWWQRKCFTLDGQFPGYSHMDVNRGIHAYRNKEHANSQLNWFNEGDMNKIVVEAIIPKGAKYYNNDLEIATNKLFIPKS